MGDTFERVKELMTSRFKLDPDQIATTTHLTELGVDSLDALEFVFDLEDAFHVTMDSQTDLRGGVVQDVVDAVNAAVSRQQNIVAGG